MITSSLRASRALPGRRRGGLVEKEVGWVFVHGPRNQNPLFLPLTDTVALGPDFGVQTQWQRLDQVHDVGRFDGLPKPFPVGYVLGYGDVAGYGVRKDKAILQHGPTQAPPVVVGSMRQPLRSNPNTTPCRFVKPKQKFEQGRFAAPAHTHNGRDLAFGNGEVNVFSTGSLPAPG